MVKVRVRVNSVKANSVDSYLGLHCLTNRLLKHVSRRQKELTFVVIGALSLSRSNKFLEFKETKIM